MQGGNVLILSYYYAYRYQEINCLRKMNALILQLHGWEKFLLYRTIVLKQIF